MVRLDNPFNYRYYYTTNIKNWTYMLDDDIEYKIKDKPNATHFKTIEHWNTEGEKFCPIYADFDGPTAQSDALSCVHQMLNNFGTVPQVYYSGSKGFHVVYPYYIKGDNCEKVAKYIMEKLGANNWKSWDDGMYKTRNMWRIVNTKNEKTGLYKIQLKDVHLLTKMLYEIKEYAKEPRKTWEVDTDKNNPFLDMVVSQYQYKEETKPEKIVEHRNYKEEMTPCIERLLAEENEEGKRHYSILVLARFFKWCGTDMDEAIGLVLTPYYKHEKHVRKVFNSVYRSTALIHFGCKNNNIMQEKCGILCKYRR